MKRFLVYLLVIVVTVSLGFGIFYLVRDNELISISDTSLYKDVNDNFTIKLNRQHKKNSTKVSLTQSNPDVLQHNADGSFTAIAGGISRVNYRTNNAKFRNLWCDVIVGDGSVDFPFYIDSAEKLSEIGTDKYPSDKCYKLVDDIDMSGLLSTPWKPIANFSGIFDGNGHTISGMNIDNAEYLDVYGSAMSTENVGMFANILAGGKVYNLKLANFVASTSANTYFKNFGIVAGKNSGTVERVEILNAKLQINTNSNTCVGSVVGANVSTQDISGAVTKARVDRCAVGDVQIGTVSSQNAQSLSPVTGIVGGLIGKNDGGELLFSYISKDSRVFLGNGVTFGGLIGVNSYKDFIVSATSLNGKSYLGGCVRDCYSAMNINTSAITSSASYAGAIGSNVDKYVQSGSKVVCNNMIGMYYISASNISRGVGKLVLNGSTYNLSDSKYFCMAKDSLDFADADTFVSYKTKVTESNNTYEIDVNWDFVNKDNQFAIWTYDNSKNEGFPVLTFISKVNVGDAFEEAGNPVITDGDNGNKDYGHDDTNTRVDITLNASNITLRMGDTFKLQVMQNVSVTFKSSNSSVATVDQFGLVTAVASSGSCVITATSTSGSTATCFVEIVDDVNPIDEYRMVLNRSQVGLIYNEANPVQSTFTLTYNVYAGKTNNLINANHLVRTDIIASENTSVATVSSVDGTNKGIITATGVGTTRIVIKAIMKNGAVVYGYCSVVVTADNNQYMMTIDPEAMTLNINYSTNKFESKRIVARVYCVDASSSSAGAEVTDSVITYTSSNPKSVASVNNMGLVTAVGPGTTTITITATTPVGTIQRTCKVVVYANSGETETKLTLTQSMTGMQVIEGTEHELFIATRPANHNVTYSVSDTSKISILASSNDSVKFRALATTKLTGAVTLTISCGTQSIKISITILENSPSGMRFTKLDDETITIKVGDTHKIVAETDLKSREIRFVIAENLGDCISFNDATNGIIKGMRTGNAKVTAKLMYGTQVADAYTFNIVVVDSGVFNPLALSTYNIEMMVGEEYEIYAFNTPSIYTTWSHQSHNNNVFKYLDNAYRDTATNRVYHHIKAVGVGEDYLVVTSGKQTAVCKIIVKEAGSIKRNVIFNVTPSPYTMAFDETAEFTCSYITEAGNTLQFVERTRTDASGIVSSKMDYTTIGNVLRCKIANGTAEHGGSYLIRAQIVNPSGKVLSYYDFVFNALSKEQTLAQKENRRYEIYNASQLDQIRSELDADWTICGTIDLNGAEWTPIEGFTGSITGGVIQNFVVTKSNTNSTAGFFGTLNGKVKNVKFVNVKIAGSNSNYNYAGVVAGKVGRNGFISDVSVADSSVAGVCVGGVVGSNTSTNSLAWNGYNLNVKNCNIVLTPVASNSTPISINCAGGIAGHTTAYIRGNAIDTTVSQNNLDNTTEVSIGGCFGSVNNTEVYGKVFNGNISSIYKNPAFVGGIAGRVDGSGNISGGSVLNSNITTAYSGMVYDNNFVGGVAGYVASSKNNAISSCLVNDTDIIGYYVGGVVGGLNSLQKMIIKWNNNVSDYSSHTQLDSITAYNSDIIGCAVENGVTITGFRAGGLVGSMNNGVVTACYAKAYLMGVNDASIKSGFTSNLRTQTVGKYGSNTALNACVIENSYSACTFASSMGKSYALANGAYYDMVDNRYLGYLIDCAFDKDIAGAQTYAPANTSMFAHKSKVPSAKTTAEMMDVETFRNMSWTNTVAIADQAVGYTGDAGTWVFYNQNITNPDYMHLYSVSSGIRLESRVVTVAGVNTTYYTLVDYTRYDA